MPGSANGLPYPLSSEPVALGADAIQDLAEALAPAWTNVSTFTNSWVNYDTTTHTRARYRLVGDIVEVEGLIKSGVSTNSAFTLPAGYRPARAFIFPSQAAGAFATLNVNADGTVSPTAASTAHVSVNFRFSVL